MNPKGPVVRDKEVAILQRALPGRALIQRKDDHEKWLTGFPILPR